MKFTRSRWQILVCAGLCAMGAALWNNAPARAQEQAAPTTAPATQAASPQDQALVAQLGADDYKVREAASGQLRSRGKAALPALKEGADSKDPEVQTRCLALIKELAEKDKPVAEANQNNLPLPLPPIINGQGLRAGVGVSISVQINNGNGPNGTVVSSVRTVTVNGATYSLSTDANGLVLSVTDGGQSTSYKAKDVEDLKKTSPEGYKIYEQIFGERRNGDSAPSTQPQP